MFKKVNLSKLLIFSFLLSLNALQINAQEEYTLIGSFNTQLISIDEENAIVENIAPLDDNFGDLNLRDIAFSHKDCVFYGILGDDANPPFVLVKIELDGTVEQIGELSLPNENILLCESLAYNKENGELYSSVSLNGGVGNNDFYSETIVRINPTDASCEYITQFDYINGTTTDVDEMVFVGNDLYLHDGITSGTSNFYKIDFTIINTAVFIPDLVLSDRYYSAQDLAYNSGKLYFPTADRELYELNIETNTIAYIGQTHEETQYDGDRIRGLDFVPSSKLEDKNPLVAHYPFNGNANDESGNGNDGVINGATLAPDRFGNPNAAYRFDGLNDFIEVGHNELINFEKDDAFSISLWVKAPSNQVDIGKTNNDILSKWVEDNSIGNSGYPFAIRTFNQEDNRIGQVFGLTTDERNCDNRNNTIKENYTPINDDKWHHLVFQRKVDSDGNTLLFYIDGKLENEVNENLVCSTQNTAPLLIGKRGIPEFTNHFTGLIDDISIYCKTLTEEEINVLYEPIEEEYTLIGSINNQLIKINTENAETDDLTTLSDDFGDLMLRDIAFSNEDCVFYGIVGDGAAPPFLLVKIDLNGEVERIGELSLVGETIGLVESIAYNKEDGQLYSSVSLNGGIANDDFYSETILKINPIDASCEQVTEVNYSLSSPTDVDQMVFVGNNLYLHDGRPSTSSNFYKIDFTTVTSVSTPSLILSDRYYSAGDLAHNDGKLYFPTNESELYELDLETNVISYIGQTHDETQYNGDRILGFDFVPNSKLKPEEGTAFVQLIHNIHDQRASLTVDGRMLVPRAKYRSASKFMKVEAGTYDLELNPVGEGYENLVQTITIRPNQSYILIAHGTFDATDDVPVEISILENAETEVNEEEVALQFFHGGFDAPEVDLLLEDILFDNVTYGNFGEAYQYLPADHYPFVLTPADDNETSLGTYGAKLRYRGGHAGLIFASGSVEEGSFGLWMALNNGRVFPLVPISNSLDSRENLIFWTKPAIQTKAIVSPNPAGVHHNLQLELLEAKNVNIYLLNARGQVLETVFEGYQDVGYHNFERQLTDLPKGLYFYEIQLNGERMVKRFMVK